jgi:hypothetical protein
MALEIIWRNPTPLAKTEQKVQRMGSEQFGAVYVVTSPDCTQEFELIPGDAAETRSAVVVNFVHVSGEARC